MRARFRRLSTMRGCRAKRCSTGSPTRMGFGGTGARAASPRPMRSPSRARPRPFMKPGARRSARSAISGATAMRRPSLLARRLHRRPRRLLRPALPGWRRRRLHPIETGPLRAARAGGSIRTYVGLYGGAAFNALQLSAGAFYAYNRYGANRTIAFPGFDDAASSGYGGDAVQAFAEAGWRLRLPASPRGRRSSRSSASRGPISMPRASPRRPDPPRSSAARKARATGSRRLGCAARRRCL